MTLNDFIEQKEQKLQEAFTNFYTIEFEAEAGEPPKTETTVFVSPKLKSFLRSALREVGEEGWSRGEVGFRSCVKVGQNKDFDINKFIKLEEDWLGTPDTNESLEETNNSLP